MVSSGLARTVLYALKLRFARALPGGVEEMIEEYPTGMVH